MENLKTYEFSFTDNEGDVYSSDEFDTLKEAKAEIARLKEFYDGDMQVKETWIFKNGNFIGRF